MTRKELAGAMLKGVSTQGVVESDVNYITTLSGDGLCKACALGCALIGKYDGDYRSAEDIYDEKNLETYLASIEILADLLGVPLALAESVEDRHCSGESIEQIAAWLKEES